ncbi:hypothetical protein ACFS27_03285 [Promicromonospora vindobonensis]|uniref:Uncharacterized protein n=1 Tax=Promicromonospora vindobonensis TaxID=195748 RepID=A0ABW5VLM7_9MICO
MTDTLFELPNPPAAPPGPPDTPCWVTAYETTTGGAATLAGGKALPRPCPTCRAWCLTGYDSNLCAFQAWATPAALTPQLEAAALILQRTTYRVWGRPGSYELTVRYVPGLHLPGRYPTANECTVIAAHVCNSPPLSDQWIRTAPPKQRIDLTDIPF